MNRLTLKVALVILLATRSATAESDSVVLVGVGRIATWFTEVVGSNPSDSPLSAHVFIAPQFEPGSCPGSLCNFLYFDLEPSGSQTLDPNAPIVSPDEKVYTLYITPEEGKPPPSIRARVVNSARPAQAISVPAFRLSRLLALNPSVLSFPGARRSEAARTNLVLADLREPESRLGSGFSAQVEVHNSLGQQLSTRTYLLGPGETRFLVDVIGQLGVESLGAGQIRVRKTAGEGHLWGTMFTTDSDGTVTVSIGAYP